MQGGQRLIEAGADVHGANFQGGTPLCAAAKSGHLDIVRLLIDCGADPAPIDAFDKRPVDYAHEAGHSEIARILQAARRPELTARDDVATNPLATMLPPRPDATLEMVRHGLQRGEQLRRAAASALEAPSMIFAVRSALGPDFRVNFAAGGDPDPRLPIREAGFVLWTCDNAGVLSCDARRAVARPPEAIIRSVAQLAEYPYLLRVWSRVAAAAAARLTVDQLADVLAVMVYPPAPPSYVEPWDWWLRCQVAAALIASHVGAEPWACSQRRQALEDVVDGPADWVNTAAIIALLDVARRDPVVRAGIERTLLAVARRPPTPPSYQHAMRPAALALLELPGISAQISGELRKLVAR